MLIQVRASVRWVQANVGRRSDVIIKQRTEAIEWWYMLGVHPSVADKTECCVVNDCGNERIKESDIDVRTSVLRLDDVAREPGALPIALDDKTMLCVHC